MTRPGEKLDRLANQDELQWPVCLRGLGGWPASVGQGGQPVLADQGSWSERLRSAAG